MVYAETARGGAPVQFLVSVPKKRVRLAVNRSLLRRRVREAYRMCRGAVDNIETDTNIPRLDVAFIYVANDVCDYNRIYKSMQKLMSVLRKHPTQTTVS